MDGKLTSGNFDSLITIKYISIKVLTSFSFHLTKNFVLFKMQKSQLIKEMS